MTEDDSRKQVPLEERLAVQAELRELENELHLARKPKSQFAIGQLLYGMSQPAVGKALNHAVLGEEVRDAVLRYRGLTIDELLAKHQATDPASSVLHVSDVASPPYASTDPLGTTEARELEKEFLPKVEKRYPNRGAAAIRGLRAREKLKPYDLRTLWEALSSVAFEERGEEVTSLDLINLAQARVLDEGDPGQAPAAPRKTKRR